MGLTNGMPGGQQRADLERLRIEPIRNTLAMMKPNACRTLNVPSENLLELYFNPANFQNRLAYIDGVITSVNIPVQRQALSVPELEQHPCIGTILDLITNGNNYTNTSNILTSHRFSLETSYISAQNNKNSDKTMALGELGNLDKDGIVDLLAQLKGVDGTLVAPIEEINKIIASLIPVLDAYRMQNPMIYNQLKTLFSFIDYGVAASQILIKLSKRAATLAPEAIVAGHAKETTGYDVLDSFKMAQDASESLGNVLAEVSTIATNLSTICLNAGLGFNNEYFTSLLHNIPQKAISYAYKLITEQGGNESLTSDSLLRSLGIAFCQSTYFITQNQNFATLGNQFMNALYTITFIAAVASQNNPGAAYNAIYDIFQIPYTPTVNTVYDPSSAYAISIALSMQNPNLVVGYYRIKYIDSGDYAELAKRIYQGIPGTGNYGIINLQVITNLKQKRAASAVTVNDIIQLLSQHSVLSDNPEVYQTLANDIVNVVSFS